MHLLKQSDLQFYLGALVEVAEQIVVDRDQLRLVHVEKLSYDAEEGKKTAAYVCPEARYPLLTIQPSSSSH